MNVVATAGTPSVPESLESRYERLRTGFIEGTSALEGLGPLLRGGMLSWMRAELEGGIVRPSRAPQPKPDLGCPQEELLRQLTAVLADMALATASN